MEKSAARNLLTFVARGRDIEVALCRQSKVLIKFIALSTSAFFGGQGRKDAYEVEWIWAVLFVRFILGC